MIKEIDTDVHSGFISFQPLQQSRREIILNLLSILLQSLMETASHLVAKPLARRLHARCRFTQLRIIYLQVNKNLTCLHVRPTY
jgi:hypothetical protein